MIRSLLVKDILPYLEGDVEEIRVWFVGKYEEYITEEPLDYYKDDEILGIRYEDGYLDFIIDGSRYIDVYTGSPI